MELFYNLADWRRARHARPHQDTLGFVPTMGNLHDGHLSLIKQSQHQNTDTLVSLFVNKTQFNNPNDFTQYPRTLADDIARLRQANVRYCLIPSDDAMYPDDYRYQINETEYSFLLEGAHRPGHFTGVLTIVMKLLNLVKPNHLYLGEKDYQQATLIQNMIDAFFMDINVVICPTIREASGLAYSSRNHRLSPTAKTQAEQFAQLFHRADDLNQTIEVLNNIGITVDYLVEQQQRRFAAVSIDGIRLIDNYAVHAPHHSQPQTTPSLLKDDA